MEYLEYSIIINFTLTHPLDREINGPDRQTDGRLSDQGFRFYLFRYETLKGHKVKRQRHYYFQNKLQVLK